MKKINKVIIKYSIVFITFSLLGSLIEFISSLIFGKGVAYDQTIYLITGLKVFFIPFYGIVGMVIFSFENLMSKYKFPIYVKGIINGSTITILELIFGFLGFIIFKVRFWDYSNQFLNLRGYISIGMFLLWSIMGFIFSLIYSSIKKLIKFLR